MIELTYLPAINLFGKEVELNAVLMFFAIILIYAGIKSFKPENEEDEKNFDNNFIIKLLKKKFPIDTNNDKGNFITKINGIRHLTPLFIALITIEFSDIIFAVDSIPAIFAISKDPLILYTSNIFAILGLRSMYFLLESIIKYFKRLRQGIAIILIFIGVKMFIADFIHISAIISLAVIFGLVTISIL
jgi:tellurite resistance protein TerC